MNCDLLTPTNVKFEEDLAVRSFAMRVVSELARTTEVRLGAQVRALSALVSRFARHGDTKALSELHAEMKRRCIPAEDVVDIYLPDVVRVIGGEWHDDELDILSASLAFARLQHLLRELGSAWTSDLAERVSGGRVLLMVPHGEQHTLGAMLAANQLRRLGVSVKVMLLPRPAVLDDVFSRNRFDGVFVSVSNESCLLPCASLCREVRARSKDPTPVIIGGGLVSAQLPDIDTRRIAEITGADVVTNDVTRALHSCGIQQCSAVAE